MHTHTPAPIPYMDPADTLELPCPDFEWPDEEDLPEYEPLADEPAQTACTWIEGHRWVEKAHYEGSGRKHISRECAYCGDDAPEGAYMRLEDTLS